MQDSIPRVSPNPVGLQMSLHLCAPRTDWTQTKIGSLAPEFMLHNKHLLLPSKSFGRQGSMLAECQEQNSTPFRLRSHHCCVLNLGLPLHRWL